MRILITGATGFVGQNLVPWLRERFENLELCLPCRNVPKGNELFPEEHIIQIDDEPAIIEFNPEITIHLAGHITSSDNSEHIEPLIEGNILYGTQLLDVLSKCSAMRLFINTGSFSEYEYGIGLQSAYLYSATKTAFRSILNYYSDKCGFKTVTATLYSVYGGKQTIKRIMDYIVESLDAPTTVDMTLGLQQLDFIHMDDVCSFFTSLIEKEGKLANGDEFHVGTGKTTNIRELVSIMEQITGKKANINWGGRTYRTRDIMYAVAAQGKNIEALNWKPNIQIHDGLQKFLKWQ